MALRNSSPPGRADLAAAGLILAIFSILKAYALSPALSDENIYFYMSKRIAEGLLPYRDFFFAHPPLHLAPGALLSALFGFSLPLMKAIPALAALLAGLALYRAGRRQSPAAGLAAVVLFLFAYDLLRASSHYTGASEATALLAWALERALAGRERSAGLLAAAAGLTAFYAVPAAVGIGAVILLRQRRAAVRYALSFAALFAGANLLCLALFGEGYWEPVFRYHFMKPAGGEGNLGATFRAILSENTWLLGGTAAALLAFAGSRAIPLRPGKTRRRPVLTDIALTGSGPWSLAFAGLAASALHVLFFASLTRVYTFYFLPAFTGLALAGAVGYTEAVRNIVTAFRDRRKRARSRLAAAVLLSLLALSGPEIIRVAAPPSGSDRQDGELLRSYTWRESPLPGSVDSAVRALFWRADRLAGERALAPTRYLWHESRHFEAPAHLAARVEALTSPRATLFGDSIATPLAALLARRRIAAEQSDSNSMRYRSGITPPGEAIAALEEDPPEAVIAAPRRGFFLVPEMRAWVLDRYKLVESYQDPIYGRYDLYLRQ